MNEARQKVLAEVDVERDRQDAEFGGDAHNDGHTPSEWVAMTIKQLGKAVSHCGMSPGGDASYDYRQRLINAAALCVSVVEALDRVGVVRR